MIMCGEDKAEPDEARQARQEETKQAAPASLFSQVSSIEYPGTFITLRSMIASQRG